MLSVEIPEKVRDSENGKNLVESGYRQWPPGSNVEIRANVSGVLVDHRAQGGGVVFIVDKVEGLDVAKGNGI
ncbi:MULTISPECIES: hypothetical protein [Xanthomonas]|uniref:Uncharacterized protein n=1 Tax=Xanthomonas dyei TaxID=743699 RepID=A0ABZ0D9J7_9XANT|nr:hypothetical protein [Xanthomonas dyei]WOB26887.1 hypothetical protein NYR99_02525 [Xanthomonas dyei]WOB54507.1 hypothetical protein NYR95_02530 [Xanthomonas dyei]